MSDEQRWRQRAACKDHPDPDLWFPEQGGAKSQSARAKVICGGCPVRFQCLGYAQRNQIPEGIWGGFGQKERWRMRRGMNTDRRRSSVTNLPEATARRLFSRAIEQGVEQTARDAGTTGRSLYRLWDHYGMGRPTDTAAYNARHYMAAKEKTS